MQRASGRDILEFERRCHTETHVELNEITSASKRKKKDLMTQNPDSERCLRPVKNSNAVLTTLSSTHGNADNASVVKFRCAFIKASVRPREERNRHEQHSTIFSSPANEQFQSPMNNAEPCGGQGLRPTISSTQISPVSRMGRLMCNDLAVNGIDRAILSNSLHTIRALSLSRREKRQDVLPYFWGNPTH